MDNWRMLKTILARWCAPDGISGGRSWGFCFLSRSQNVNTVQNWFLCFFNLFFLHFWTAYLRPEVIWGRFQCRVCYLFLCARCFVICAPVGNGKKKRKKKWNAERHWLKREAHSLIFFKMFLFVRSVGRLVVFILFIFCLLRIYSLILRLCAAVVVVAISSVKT